MYDNCNFWGKTPVFFLTEELEIQILFGYLYINQMFSLGLYMLSLKTVYKHMSADCVPRSPKCAASMWLGCFLRMAVRPRAKESMLAEMALMATWLGPAASWMALWFLSPSDGEWGLAGAAGGGQKTDVRQKKKKKREHNDMKAVSGPSVWHQCDFLWKGLFTERPWKSSQSECRGLGAREMFETTDCSVFDCELPVFHFVARGEKRWSLWQ